MQTKMKIVITVKGAIDSAKLYEELSPYNFNVTDMIDKTLVHATIDIREPIIEKALKICNLYGECDVEAHMVGKEVI